MKTGNQTVDAVGKMHFEGDIICPIWLQTLVDTKGKVNMLSVLILGRILYWYRPTFLRDEYTGDIVSAKTKFRADLLQMDYKALHERYTPYDKTKKAVTAAMDMLENLGIIKRHFRTVKGEYRSFSNVMFVELIVDGLMKVTYPSDYPSDYNHATPKTEITEPINTEQKEVVLVPHGDLTPQKNSNNNTLYPNEDTGVSLQGYRVSTQKGIGSSQQEYTPIPSPVYSCTKNINTKITNKDDSSPVKSSPIQEDVLLVLKDIKDGLDKTTNRNFNTKKDLSKVEIQQQLDFINKNICYDSLYDIHGDLATEWRDVILDAVTHIAPTIRIGSEDKSTNVVKSVMQKLDYDTVFYAITKYKRYDKPVKNKIAFIRTVLYNSKHEITSQQHNAEALDRASGNKDLIEFWDEEREQEYMERKYKKSE